MTKSIRSRASTMSVAISESMSKKDFVRHVQLAAREKYNSDSSSSEESLRGQGERAEFNRRTSENIEGELKDYVKKFTQKVNLKFKTSKTNNKFQLPRYEISSDSESSIKSLNKVTYYDLSEQNEKKILNETDKLIEIIYELGSLERNELYIHMTNVRSPLYALFFEIVKIKENHDQRLYSQKASSPVIKNAPFDKRLAAKNRPLLSKLYEDMKISANTMKLRNKIEKTSYYRKKLRRGVSTQKLGKANKSKYFSSKKQYQTYSNRYKYDNKSVSSARSEAKQFSMKKHISSYNNSNKEVSISPSSNILDSTFNSSSSIGSRSVRAQRVGKYNSMAKHVKKKIKFPIKSNILEKMKKKRMKKMVSKVNGHKRGSSNKYKEVVRTRGKAVCLTLNNNQKGAINVLQINTYKETKKKLYSYINKEQHKKKKSKESSNYRKKAHMNSDESNKIKNIL